MQESVTKSLGAYVAKTRYEILSKDVIREAKRRIADVLAIGLSGAITSTGRAMRNFSEQFTGKEPKAGLWGSKKKAQGAIAALSNATIRLIGENVRLACANDHELKATENMLIASALGGVVLSQTRLGNAHALAHPVGGRFGVHHGLANAVLLPYVMEFNLQARPEKFAAVAEALGVDTGGLTAYKAAPLAVDAVRELNEILGIPDKLGPLGVKTSAIGHMAKAAMQSGNIAVNPRKTCQEDLEEILKKAI